MLQALLLDPRVCLAPNSTLNPDPQLQSAYNGATKVEPNRTLPDNPAQNICHLQQHVMLVPLHGRKHAAMADNQMLDLHAHLFSELQVAALGPCVQLGAQDGLVQVGEQHFGGLLWSRNCDDLQPGGQGEDRVGFVGAGTGEVEGDVVRFEGRLLLNLDLQALLVIGEQQAVGLVTLPANPTASEFLPVDFRLRQPAAVEVRRQPHRYRGAIGPDQDAFSQVQDYGLAQGHNLQRDCWQIEDEVEAGHHLVLLEEELKYAADASAAVLAADDELPGVGFVGCEEDPALVLSLEQVPAFEAMVEIGLVILAVGFLQLVWPIEWSRPLQVVVLQGAVPAYKEQHRLLLVDQVNSHHPRACIAQTGLANLLHFELPLCPGYTVGAPASACVGHQQEEPALAVPDHSEIHDGVLAGNSGVRVRLGQAQQVQVVGGAAEDPAGAHLGYGHLSEQVGNGRGGLHLNDTKSHFISAYSIGVIIQSIESRMSKQQLKDYILNAYSETERSKIEPSLFPRNHLGQHRGFFIKQPSNRNPTLTSFLVDPQFNRCLREARIGTALNKMGLGALEEIASKVKTHDNIVIWYQIEPLAWGFDFISYSYFNRQTESRDTNGKTLTYRVVYKWQPKTGRTKGSYYVHSIFPEHSKRIMS